MPPVYPKRFIKWYLRTDKPQCNWRPEKVVELPQMKSWNYTCNGEQNSKGTRENLDNICLDKVFCVLKESLMIINSDCGKQFLHLCGGFCCHEHDPVNILWLSSHHDQRCRSSCSVGSSGTHVSVWVICSGSAAEHLCVCVWVCVWREERGEVGERKTGKQDNPSNSLFMLDN